LEGLRNEAGGHRLQRIPPTERRGRVHTSTVTVSVTDNNISTNPKYAQRSESDFRVEWFSGTGKGGQKRNKSQSCCRLIHIPTNLVETRQGRSRESNFSDAMLALNKNLDTLSSGEKLEKLSTEKKIQVGSGMRGDKRRTYRFQDDIVVDHITNKKSTCSKIMRGEFNLLW
ncbi:MAG: PCRF domain-containing protein, partial [Richelia sp. RM2_1_2]|nr:PCRF domain-containing protein [Richelia sp. RM2_1_2]